MIGAIPIPVCDCPDLYGLGDCSGKCVWWRIEAWRINQGINEIREAIGEPMYKDRQW